MCVCVCVCKAFRKCFVKERGVALTGECGRQTMGEHGQLRKRVEVNFVCSGQC